NPSVIDGWALSASMSTASLAALSLTIRRMLQPLGPHTALPVTRHAGRSGHLGITRRGVVM
ncbi:MAG TPA: hypothetical protein VNP92_26680, partial [Actinophytocola sp.]|nr:hypothetical protein [Actinophytocola sp.]